MIDRSKYGLPGGSDMFRMASGETKILTRELAEKEKLYVTGYVLRILRIYGKEEGIQNYHLRKIIKELKESDKDFRPEIRKIGINNMRCFSREDLMKVMTCAYEKGLIEKYDEKEIDSILETPALFNP